MPSVKTIISVPSITIFPKKKSFLFYKSKSIGQTPIFTCFYQVPCVFVGSEFLGSHHRLRTPSDTVVNFHRWIHMSNKEYRVFHPRGIYPFLIYPTHVFFISFFCYAIVRLILDIVPFYQAHHRTPNTVLIYHVLTTYHQSPNIVSISTIHSHPCHAMSRA